MVIRESKQIGVYCPVNTLFVPIEGYLKAQGHIATRIPKSDSYTGFDQQFDVIVIWTDKKSTLNPLLRLTSIVQRTKKEADISKEPPLAPVLAFIYKDSPIAQEGTKKISLMYNEFDLRKFDENLTGILENKIISLPENDEEQKTENT